eukprot:GHVR01098585.1.p1 GENE.GHVR01098585.1~~GHVR01098585.1.p1  ORF type:complete len:162 (+),score=21.16 GHVR01098585.1:119-604(+)
MSLQWLKNYAGGRLTDEQMKDIPYPLLELGIHVSLKNVQLFSCLGMLAVGPALALIRKKPIGKTMFTAGKYGTIIGLGTGPAMTLAKAKSLDQDGLYDRAYRLRNNRGQLFVDQMAALFGTCGIISGFFMGKGIWFGGAVFGGVSGVIFAGLFNNVLKKKK